MGYRDLSAEVLEDLRGLALQLGTLDLGVEVPVEGKKEIEFKEVHAQKELDSRLPDGNVRESDLQGMRKQGRAGEEKQEGRKGKNGARHPAAARRQRAGPPSWMPCRSSHGP